MITKPQFSLPQAIAGTVTIHFSDATTTAISVTSATRWNDRTLAAATDAWAYVVAALSSGDSGGTWAASEPSSGLLGRAAATRTPSDGKTVTKIVFSGGLTGAMFGFSTDEPTAAANVVTGTWQRSGLWLARGGRCYTPGSWGEDSDLVIETMSDDGSSTRDYYGTVTEVPIEIFMIPGALIYPDHNTSTRANINGLLTTDPNVSWQTFVKTWRDTDTSTASAACRYAPDRDTPTTYYSLNTLRQGLGRASASSRRTSKAPLLYRIQAVGVVAPG